MRCEDFEIRLNDVLDERRPPSSAPELVEHARRCGACRDMARGYEEMLAGLSHERLPPAPSWLTERVVNEVLPRTQADRTSAWRSAPRLSAFALAASMLIAASVTWWIDSQRKLPDKVGGDDVRVVQAVNDRRAEPPAPSTVEAPKASPVVGEIAASRADARETDDAIGILSGAEWAPAGAAWAQEVADGLQPVTRPTVGAITGFLNLWGISGEGHRS